MGEFEYYYLAHSSATRGFDPDCYYLMFVENGKEYWFVRLQECRIKMCFVPDDFRIMPGRQT
jgi:hypothetical protein